MRIKKKIAIFQDLDFNYGLEIKIKTVKIKMKKIKKKKKRIKKTKKIKIIII